MSTFPVSTEQATADSWRKPTLRHLLEETDRFLVAVELVTSHGVISDLAGQRVLSHALALAESDRIDVLSITENPAGNAMLAADTLGADLRSHGQEVIIHLACKDGNRNSLQSRAWKLASEGFDNILALTGDYPKPGYGGMARPSFDIDSVGLLAMYSEMNRGLFDEATGRRLKPTNFFLGAVVTNHKRHERELVPQYLKLRKKIEIGARFVINQAGYDARKDDELLRWLALSSLDVPVIANVFVLSLGAARAFNAGRVPGVVVTDELVALAERYAASPDRGRSFFLDLAVKQVAIARGLGFRGAYLGGKLDLADCEEILSRADEIRSGWMEEPCGRCQLRLLGRVLLFRARRDNRPVLLGVEPRSCRIAHECSTATSPRAYAGQLPCQPFGSLGGLRPHSAAVRRRPEVLLSRRVSPGVGAQSPPLRRARFQSAALQLQGLR